MPSSTATQPAPGHSLYAEASRSLATPFAAPKWPGTAATRPAASGMLNLFRMSSGMNSIDSDLLVERIVHD